MQTNKDKGFCYQHYHLRWVSILVESPLSCNVYLIDFLLIYQKWSLFTTILQKCKMGVKSEREFTGLSPLSSFVVRRKILVAAGHVITQNMLGERGGRLFGLFLWQTLWVSKPQAVAKNYPLYRGSKSNLSIKNATLFLLSSKYRRLPFTK